MVQIASLLQAISTFYYSNHTDSTSGALAARQTSGSNSLPPACLSPCQVLNTITNCGSSVACVCTNSVGTQLEQCSVCLFNADPALESDSQNILDSWNQLCGGSLSLSGGSGAGSPTINPVSASPTAKSGGGGSSNPIGSISSGGSSATPTAKSSGGGSSSNPFGSISGGATGLRTNGMAVCACVAAALVGSFMSLSL